MKQDFYSLPLKLDAVMLKKDHAKCSLEKSVTQHLHLILTTAFGEFPNDASFGCSIWDCDFDNVSGGYRLKEFIRTSILHSIGQHEKRLSHARVEIAVQQEELSALRTSARVKKKIEISITAVLQLTNEKFGYRDTFFIGPLSY